MADEVTEEQFCARFVAQMMKALPNFDGSEDELRSYAEETAPTYYAEPWQRVEGPEECARTDVSYWEEG
jgi:hypothetical protein